MIASGLTMTGWVFWLHIIMGTVEVSAVLITMCVTIAYYRKVKDLRPPK